MRSTSSWLAFEGQLWRRCRVYVICRWLDFHMDIAPVQQAGVSDLSAIHTCCHAKLFSITLESNDFVFMAPNSCAPATKKTRIRLKYVFMLQGQRLSESKHLARHPFASYQPHYLRAFCMDYDAAQPSYTSFPSSSSSSSPSP